MDQNPADFVIFTDGSHNEAWRGDQAAEDLSRVGWTVFRRGSVVAEDEVFYSSLVVAQIAMVELLGAVAAIDVHSEKSRCKVRDLAGGQ